MTETDPNGRVFEVARGKTYLVMSREPADRLGVRCHRFWIVDAEGRVRESFGPEFASDCEYGCPIEYAMKDGTLFRFSGRSNDAYTHALTSWRAEVVCTAWRELAGDDPVARRLRGQG